MEGINNKTPNFKQRYHYTQNQYNAYPYAPRHKEPVISDEQRPFVTAGILQAAAILLTKASEWCGKKLMQGKEFTNSNNVKLMASQMLNDNNLQNKVAVEFVDNSNAAAIAERYGKQLIAPLGPVAKGENAFYTDTFKLAVAPKNKPSLILHELGHAVNAHKGKFLKILQKSRIYAASVPTILLLLNSSAPKPDREKTFIEKHALKIGFLAFLPTIIEEGLASLRGIKAANQVKKTIDKTINLKPLKRNYAFAWLTYVIAGLGLGVAAKQSIVESKMN